MMQVQDREKVKIYLSSQLPYAIGWELALHTPKLYK